MSIVEARYHKSMDTLSESCAAFTRKPSHFRQGIVFLVFFSCAAVGSPLGLHFETSRAQDGCLGTRELLVAAFWSCWIIAAIWNLLDFFCHSITLSDDGVHLKGVFGERTILLAHLDRVRWYPFFSLKVFSKAGNRVIWLGNYRREDRKQLIRYFRECLPLEHQEGWRDIIELERQYRSEIESFRKVLPKLLTMAFVAGPVVGLAGGLFLQAFSRSMNATASTWTGSVVLDWVPLGFCVGPGLGLLLAGRLIGTRPGVSAGNFARITEGMEQPMSRPSWGHRQQSLTAPACGEKTTRAVASIFSSTNNGE